LFTCIGEGSINGQALIGLVKDMNLGEDATKQVSTTFAARYAVVYGNAFYFANDVLYSDRITFTEFINALPLIEEKKFAKVSSNLAEVLAATTPMKVWTLPSSQTLHCSSHSF
jgi:hypothetical protein